jgi:predicted DCC family thiol-disulfide oxidoreductase YuxK
LASLESLTLENKQAPATVFYDGACALCRREIAHYRRLKNSDAMRWVDISCDQATLDAQGLTRADAMQRLHVRDAAGNWHVGAWAFAELWSHLPGYRWLAAALRRSRTLPLLDRGYALFARWRLRRRCATGTCSGMTPDPRRERRRHHQLNSVDTSSRLV